MNREDLHFTAIVLGVILVLGGAGVWLAVWLEKDADNYDRLVRQEQAKCEKLGGSYYKSHEDRNICFQKGVIFPSASRR